jgi:hypothetical protein
MGADRAVGGANPVACGHAAGVGVAGEGRAGETREIVSDETRP